MSASRVKLSPFSLLIVIAGLILWATAWAGAEPPSTPPAASPLRQPQRPGPAGPQKSAERAREGTPLTEARGSFELVGDRVIFVPAGGGDSLRVLENLALERVVRELGDGRDQRDWEVAGILTEYHGSNYLLVTRAVVKAPPAPT